MSLGYGVAAVAAGLWAYKERRELVAGLPSDEALRAAATFSSRYRRPRLLIGTGIFFERVRVLCSVILLLADRDRT